MLYNVVLVSAVQQTKSVIYIYIYMKVLVTQSCLTLCDPVDCHPPGSSVHGDSPGKNIGMGTQMLVMVFVALKITPAVASPKIK